MGITLDLPDELKAALSDEADRLNLPLSEYILRLLTTARPRHTMPVTGAELVAYWQREGLSVRDRIAQNTLPSCGAELNDE